MLVITSVSALISAPKLPLTGYGSCCIPYYEGEITFEQPKGVLNPDVCANLETEPGIYVKDCFRDGHLIDYVLTPRITFPLTETGCCCEQRSETLRESIYSTDNNLFVSRLYCSDLGYDYLGDQNDCVSSCLNLLDVTSVTGIVYLSNGTLLEGITVRANEDFAISDVTGQVSFSKLFVEGQYDFSVIIPSDYYLSCTTNSVSQFVFGNEIEVDILLNCVKRDELVNTCIPVWKVQSNGEWVKLESAGESGWSVCEYYGNIQGWLKSRVVKDFGGPDKTGCPTTSNVPPIITSEGCEDKQISADCNDGFFDPENELCDAGTFSYNDNEYQEPFSCEQALGNGYLGNIECTSKCFFDLNGCKPPCDCSSQDQCSGLCEPICKNSGTCQKCQKALRFIPDSAPSRGDLFELYKYLDGFEDDAYPLSPIEYTLGSSDVTLDWEFDKTCRDNLLGFDVMICRDNGDGDCDLNFQEEIRIASLNDYSTTQHTFKDVLKPYYYVDDVLEPVSYCYNIIARLESEEDLSAFQPGNYPCFQTGFDMCMSPLIEGKNCVNQNGEGYGPAYCLTYDTDSRVNLKFKQSICSEQMSCIETRYVEGSDDPDELGAMCVRRENCQSCNGIFGLFASYNLRSTYDGGTSSYDCDELLFTTQIGVEIPGSSAYSVQQAQCFRDESKTLFSFFDDCQKITSCYDYASSGTCQQDPCFKFSNTTHDENNIINFMELGCEWQEYENEFGIGVCRPVEEKEQNCELCDTDSPLGFCDANMCGAYGTCYLKEAYRDIEKNMFPLKNRVDQVPACLDITDMSCILYETQRDCIGDATLRIDPIVDVLYTPESISSGLEGTFLLPEHRIAGTNRQQQFSNDLLHFGDCAWNYEDNACYKNSNNFKGIHPEDDCYDLDKQGLNCFKDNEPPITTIFLKDPVEEERGYLLYGLGELEHIKFGVEDEYSLPEEIKTYVSFLSKSCFDNNMTPCLAPDQINCLNSSSSVDEITSARKDHNCYIYPQYTLPDLIKNFDILESMIATDGGDHLIIFFSEDNARNLESLKSRWISIDNSKPVVIINDTVKRVRQLYEDTYVTDLTLSVNVYEKSNCEAQLKDLDHIENEILPGLVVFEADEATESSPQNFKVSFPQLEDGSYKFIVKCLDDFSNKGEPTEENNPIIELNADASITPLFPLGDIFIDEENIPLRILTRYLGDCNFSFGGSSTPFPYPVIDEDNIYSDKDDQYVYEMLYPHTELSSISGTYRLLISCDFGSGRLTQGQSGDLLFFSIDKIPPTGQIIELGDDYIVETASWKPSRSLQITCDDANLNTPFGTNKGCASIHYCIDNFEDDTTCPSGFIPIPAKNDFSETLTTEIKLKLENAYTFLHYFFKDRGGTSSSVVTINTKIRDTTTHGLTIVVG